jgi:carbonic anhydrase/acetyltransferase-like protein (isoleucine patch superfamily)
MAYDGVRPHFASPPAFAGSGAAVLGRATLGKSAWLGARSVIRADGHYVEIGDDFRLGARGTVHIAHAVLPTHIGSGVTARVNSVIHACDVGHRCHIGRDVVILDGSNVSAECALADGSIVFPRSVLESGWLYAGSPAKPVRRLMDRELDDLHAQSRAAADDHIEEAPWTPHIESPSPLFVACSARLRGRIVAGGENGVWFGCDLDAGESEIRIGSNSNIQDNTIIRVRSRPATIGRESTIGHNVRMEGCSIGDRSLIGIGAVVAPGTIVGNDVLLAAGARTLEGQVLDDGGFFGGSPARRLAPLDDKKRAIIALTWPTYCHYASSFRLAQDELLTPSKALDGLPAPRHRRSVRE